ncbi:CLUMA_CG014891, isoform A [Clunio marinus]|uniref:CLUMA_CG014891, isoform A n=1 Tax=Clunio marinus TaxID=568069 RepID=A0A1J1INE1_9DIPT|nr:CLUMA_CG014891, isoform A [Clunio marinus]
MVDNTDYIGNFLGPIGKWQLRTIFLIYLTKIPSSWFMSCIIFTAPTPYQGEIYCKPPVDKIKDNVQEWIKIAHPIKEEQTDQEVVIDFCNIYEDAIDHIREYYNNTEHDEIDLFKPPSLNSTKLIPCESFEHKPTYASIITQFDLYCSRNILVAVTQFCHLFGVLSGGIITTFMMNHFEPRYTMLIGMLTQILCGNLTGLVNVFELHIFFRCLSAVCCGLMYTAGGLIFTDITSGKYKIIAVCMFEQFWSIGIMLLPAVASYWESWSYLYMAISYPTLILIFLYPLIPNSPRWLLKKGRIREAKEILLEAARINGKTDFTEAELEKQLEVQAASLAEAPPEPSYWEMWRGQFKNLAACHISWSVYIVIYYGFLLNVRNFDRTYLRQNTIICGICEITGTFIGLWLILNTRRKWLYTSIINFIASFISLSAHLIPANVTPFQRLILLMVTSSASKIAISSTLGILMTCTSEIVSPEKRRLCSFTSTVWTRIWLLSAPFVGATSVFGQLVPQTIMAVLNIFGSLVTSLIDTPRSVEKKEEDVYIFYPKEIPVPEIWLSGYKEYKTHL